MSSLEISSDDNDMSGEWTLIGKILLMDIRLTRIGSNLIVKRCCVWTALSLTEVGGERGDGKRVGVGG